MGLCEPVGASHRDVRPPRVTEEAIRCLVDRFYDKVRANPDLGPVFERAIGDNWDPHLATMYDFWSSVMLTSGRYKGNPVAVHLKVVGLEPPLFEHWLALFDETCRELLDESSAEAFRIKAQRIAESLKLSLFYRPEGRLPGNPT